MGVCKRTVAASAAGAPFYAWRGWGFLTVIGIIVAWTLFYYNYVNVREQPPRVIPTKQLTGNNVVNSKRTGWRVGG